MRKILFFTVCLVLIGAAIWLFQANSHQGSLQKVNTSKTTSTGTSKTQDTTTQVKIQPTTLPLHVPAGFMIGTFATGLGTTRDLQFSPDGILLASDLNGSVYALPDINNDGQADTKKVIISNLRRPHGLAFYQGKLYVAEETKVSRYSFDEKNLTATFEKKILDLPVGGRHFTRSLLFDSTGKLYVSIGSTCDVCYEQNPWYATVIVTDKDGMNPQVFAKGLRNAVFLTLKPETDTVWSTVMERDYLGDTIPADEIDILQNSKDYGWPNCYGNKIHDTSFDKKQYVRDPCADTFAPSFELPAHVAPLGLTFINSPQFPQDFQGDLLVAYHGSGHSSHLVGYKVVRLHVQGDQVTGADDFVTGFLKGSQVIGRPVDLTFDLQGSLYISDDKTGSIFKVIKK